MMDLQSTKHLTGMNFFPGIQIEEYDYDRQTLQVRQTSGYLCSESNTVFAALAVHCSTAIVYMTGIAIVIAIESRV